VLICAQANYFLLILFYRVSLLLSLYEERLMDIDSLLDPLTRALSQSQALLSLAQAGDWESFETLVQQRQQGLLSLNDQEYLQSLAHADLEAKAASVIQEIQTINKALALLAEANRENAASELRQNSRAARAIDAYGR
jgi:flagellar protein FliT